MAVVATTDTQHTADEEFMRTALDLAARGQGTTSPNPMVGAVVVRGIEIIGSGYHERAGEPHAEVLALREAGDRARGATLYVTLEPCSHYGRTPPCSRAIVESGITRVVSAMTDPNPKVAGSGHAGLAAAGIAVTTGVLEGPARRLNEAYIKYITTGTPFVTLKLALTLDGKIADRHRSSKWITGENTRAWVHRLRARSDAVMIGAGTVTADDPQLTVRHGGGRNPLKVIVDRRLQTPPDARVCQGGICLIATGPDAESVNVERLAARGVEVVRISVSPDGLAISELLRELGKREITSVLCEGGGTLAGTLIREQMVDKFVLMYAPKIMGGDGIDAFRGTGIDTIRDIVALDDIAVDRSGEDIVVTGYPVWRAGTP